MKPKTHNHRITVRPSELAPDPASVQAGVDYRLAHRFGVSLALAGTLASLAGIGPHMREAR